MLPRRHDHVDTLQSVLASRKRQATLPFMFRFRLSQRVVTFAAGDSAHQGIYDRHAVTLSRHVGSVCPSQTIIA
jgi:hypothetical protein